MKKNSFIVITILLLFNSVNAQVLWSENFDSYPSGHLNTDYTGATVGQGGWRAERHSIVIGTAMVAPETGKGNVLSITTNGTLPNEYANIIQDDIDALWNNRAAGNNVLKFEYEVYGTGQFIATGSLLEQSGPNFTGPNFMTIMFQSTTLYRIRAFYTGSSNSWTALRDYSAATFPYNMWHKVEMFIDYDAKKVYFYIPTLNLFRADTITSNFVQIPYHIRLEGSALKSGSSVVKYDNIKLSALQSVPPYILSANEWVSATFNLYPNPATDVVNITNSENMQVQQVIIYDIAGKQLSTQTFSNQTEIQLNVENLASGVYMLHIQTNAGVAVKKLVKK